MNAPKGLTRPGVMTTVLSKKPIFLMMGLILVIILLLIFSIFESGGEKNKKNQQETVLIEPGVSTTTDEEGLNLPKPPEGYKGVAQEQEITPAPKKFDREPIQVIPVSKPKKSSKKPFDKLREKHRLSIRKYWFDQERAALESRLITYQNETPVFTLSDQTNKSSSSQRSALNQQLKQVKSNLSQLSSQQGSQRGSQKGAISAHSGPSNLLSVSTSDGTDNSDKWDNGYSMDTETNALSIKTGSILPSVLITGINSTLSGYISSQISQDVWDTATGYNLLIPQGTKIFGQYKNQVLMGQERLFVVWQRLIFPDGRTMTLDDMPGADQLGYSGLKDQVNNHYLRIYGHALLMSLVTGTTAFAIDSLDSNTSETTTFSESMGSALAEQMGQTTMSLLSKHMDMAPTLNIRPGYRLNVIVVKDLEFDEPYEGKL